MARPTKQGIDYFSLDCIFDDDLQLFITENGADSLGILVVTWQMIYQNEGYFIAHDKKLIPKIKQRILSDSDRIIYIINEAISWGIFNETLHEKHKILTSSGIQKRYLIASRLKKEVKFYTDYMLIDVSSVGNGVNVVGNPFNIVGNATKVKVKEEVKEKESKPSQVEEVFSFWQESLNHKRAKLDDSRKGIIKKAFKNYSQEELKAAIIGCSVTPHNMGQNDSGEVYDGLHVIFKDSNNIERFIRNSKSPPVQKQSNVTTGNFQTPGQRRTQANMQAAQDFINGDI